MCSEPVCVVKALVLFFDILAVRFVGESATIYPSLMHCLIVDTTSSLSCYKEQVSALGSQAVTHHVSRPFRKVDRWQLPSG